MIVILTSIDPVRQIANAHTFFNLANTVIQLPLCVFACETCHSSYPDRLLLLSED